MMTAISAPARRDQAIDMLRGYALVTITINHLTGIVYQLFSGMPPFPTLSHYGFSSAAELFFILSGYLLGAVYLRAGRPVSIRAFAGRMGARAGKLYVYNFLLFLALLGLAAWSTSFAQVTFYRYFIDGGPRAIGEFALLYAQPYNLEILATYVVFLALAPVFAWALVRAPAITALLSAALWLYAQGRGWLMIPGGTPAGDWKWNFNPASWQFLFLGAMAAGRFRLLDRLKDATRAHPGWVAGLALLFALLTAWFVAQPALVANGLGWAVPGQSKTFAAPVRVLHALSVILLFLAVAWRWPSLQANPVGRALGAVGAASLQAFVASTVIAYALGFLWIELRMGYAGYMMLSAIGALALVAFAYAHRGFVGWRSPQRASAAPQPA